MSGFEEHRSLDGPQREILDETLKRMVQAPHAAADFRDVIIERVGQLPPPRDSWWRRLGDADVWVVLRPPRMMTVVWVGMLVCCLIGLSYTYQQIANLQAENWQQQAGQQPSQIVVAKRTGVVKPPSLDSDASGRPLTQAERDALSQVTLDAKQMEAGEVPGAIAHPSLWGRFLQAVKRTKATAKVWWAELRQVWTVRSPQRAPERAPDTVPANESAKP